MDDNGNPVNAQRSPLTVIVAEKHPIARAALAALLSYDGYRVFQAESLNAAIANIDTVYDVAVLLVDLDMPGWRTIVRHVLRASDALVIGMEGNHPISEMYDLNERGIRLCLKKPILYDKLRAAIEENVRFRDAGDLGLKRIYPDQNKRSV